MLDGLSQTGGILDDLIFTGENNEQHARNLCKTLMKFDESGAKLKKSKFVIIKPKIFAGPSQHASTSCKGSSNPRGTDQQNQSELQSFLGLVNY